MERRRRDSGISRWGARIGGRDIRHGGTWVLLISIQQSALGIQPAGGVTRMKNFRDLRVWQKARQLTLGAYAATTNFLRQEIYGLSSQIRRCAVSIPANIAEGCGKRGNAEFQRFLEIAAGS